MASMLFYNPFIPAFNSNGLPIAGAALHFFVSGTSTPAKVYSDAELTTELENPAVSNAAALSRNLTSGTSSCTTHRSCPASPPQEDSRIALARLVA